MRVAIVIGSMHAGGAERVTANLANAWAERGWEVTLITIASDALDFYPLDTDVRRIALDLARDSGTVISAIAANVRRVFRLRRVLREVNPVVIVAMMSTAAVLAILASAGLGCRTVVSERIHPPMLPIRPAWAWLRRFTYRYAYRVVLLSAESLRWLSAEVPRARGVVIPNPVQFPLPTGEPKLPPHAIVAPHRKLLLAVGRLHQQKGFDVLLRSFAKIAGAYPDWDLVILGEGPERETLTSLAHRLGVLDRFHSPGRVGNIGDWYRRADVYVMSSRFEGFPNSLAEAMAHGVAVVSYDCHTGPGEIICDEVDGVLVAPVGDPAALSSALDRLMSDEHQRLQLSARAVDVRDRYAPAKVLALWDRLLQDCP